VDHLAPFRIPFVGLKPGKHEFQMEVDATFFDSFPFSEITQASGLVEVTLDKLGSRLVCLVNFTGRCLTPCDRCLAETEVSLDFTERLIAQLGGQTDLESDIWTLGTEVHELNLAQPVFEWIHLCLPFRRVHESTDSCDPLMLKHLNASQRAKQDKKGNDDDDDAVDPRWNALKDLK
jgi:uncharacterized protein